MHRPREMVQENEAETQRRESSISDGNYSGLLSRSSAGQVADQSSELRRPSLTVLSSSDQLTKKPSSP